jgi:hypothetical protein
MDTDTAKRNKGSKDIQENTSTTADTITDLGDTSRDTTDTADVSRASIAKGIGGVQESKSAADIIEGKIEDSNESIVQGITQDSKRHDNNKVTFGRQGEPTNAAVDHASKEEVSSGTSVKEDKSLDKADIYPTENSGTRHIERAQEKPAKKVEDKEKGSWKVQ